ncbi:putative dioxygenase [Calycina marina]|uniref:Dioxygenase n=1 Tax=Calycina marina TaxID=1763456 RepID=A0A9P7Z134_9HELO|nr:putative dioxygenase [Calycina marina]
MAVISLKTICNTLCTHHVVFLKPQSGLSPKAQYELTKRFDPASSNYGRGKTLDSKRSVLHRDLKTIPHQPQLQVIGNGHYDEYEIFVPEEDDLVANRFFRWRIDAALYALNPPKVTLLMAGKVPAGRRQTVRYDAGSGHELDVLLGTTAFVSDKGFARTTKMEFVPHPYIWMSPVRSRSDGLGMVSDGLELPLSDLSPVDEQDIKLALIIHPSAIKAIHFPNGEVMSDLEEVREKNCLFRQCNMASSEGVMGPE